MVSRPVRSNPSLESEGVVVPGLLVVGVGPGIAASVARRFAVAGYPVGLISRSRASVDPVAMAVAALGPRVVTETADAAQESELIAAIDRIVAQLGVPDVVVYNAGLIRADKPGELEHAQHQAAYGVNVLGALTTAAHLAPKLAANSGGTILITGGMPRPVPGMVSLSLGKAGVRALTNLLAQEYGPSSVHVATVTVCGPVAPGTSFDPDRIAEYYWRLHNQTPGEWEHEVAFTGDGT
jgi:NAD(P)-dependent dehydrogenase (short-subunit alcohol dehydrogenase family)